MIYFAPANDDCVAGVVAALIAGDDVEMGREQIDDLALAFVSPLRADDCEVLVWWSLLSGLSRGSSARILRRRLIAVIGIVMPFFLEVAFY